MTEKKEQPQYPIIELGYGTVNVADGIQGGEYALILESKEAGAIGETTRGNRPTDAEKCLAILRFHNPESLDVVIGRLQALKENMQGQVPVRVYDDAGVLIHTEYPNSMKQAQ